MQSQTSPDMPFNACEHGMAACGPSLHTHAETDTCCSCMQREDEPNM